MQLTSRPRYFVRPPWLRIARVLFRYSYLYDVYVPRLVGMGRGPVLRPERREVPDRPRPQQAVAHADERRLIPAPGPVLGTLVADPDEDGPRPAGQRPDHRVQGGDRGSVGVGPERARSPPALDLGPGHDPARDPVR